MGNIIVLIVVSIVIFVPGFILGLFMLAGYGGTLIAGYHYAPKTKRAKVYHKKFMRIIACWYFALLAVIYASVVFFSTEHEIIGFVCLGLMVLITIAFLVHVNCNKKVLELIKKGRDDYTEDVKYHDSEDNIEYHESKDDIEYHNCENDQLKNYSSDNKEVIVDKQEKISKNRD